MSLDVGTLPEVHLALEAGSWDDPPGTAWPRPPDADSDSWESGPPAPPRDSPSPPIDAVEPNRAGPAPDAAPPSGSEPEAQLELFQKLGFSLAQVRAVMAKLGLRSDTDRVLGELVRAGCEGEEGAGPQGPMGPPGPLGLTPCRDGAGPAPQSWAALSACQADPSEEDGALRPVVLDGSNVAMSHGNKEVFSCLGIQLAVNYFLDRGHTDITVFVPSWRKEQPRPDVPITDQHLLRELERRRIVVFTPSRRVAGKRVACHDDRFIVKLAHDTDGVIVSNDTYRDLQRERAEWRRVIEERLLMYSFVNDKFMPPDDPLGRHGPTLDNFLRRTPRPPKRLPCPYGKKCTYGLKCRFSHPERGTQSQRALADELRDRARTPATAPSPGPAPSPPLEEVLRRKLTLGQRRGSLRRAQTSENVPLVKGQPSLGQVQPSGSRKCEAGCRRAPSGLDRAVERAPGGCCCPDCLDSGLGSYESRPSELHPAPSDTRCHEPDGRRSHGHCYSPSPSPPCSCCPPPRHAAAMGGGLQHTSLGLSNPRPADVMAAYRPPHYASYVPYGPAPYSVPHVYPHARAPPPDPDYWSEPYGVYRPQAEGARWPPHAPPSAEREQVRKKLLGIFNARLVERAMELFPHEVDPQVLTAEIFTLRSQEGLL